ncbi:MAG: S4 domain-containing protein [Bacteroidales bacterium]|nr:S4 domain-containing protein [Bacteroidales bacterium]
MENQKGVRLDKFLWAVRLYKTRSIAADACKSGRILINGYPVKSSRLINIDETFMVKKNPVIYLYKVKELLSNRVGAKLVENYIENLTSEEELQKLDLNSKVTFVRRSKGTGRPTKKERREIDKLNF